MTVTEETVLIHGHKWKSSDVQFLLGRCGGLTWIKRIWKCQPALVDKSGGIVEQYVGQKYDPSKSDLVADAWTHDHCAICGWALFESPDQEHGVGYLSNEGSWACSECYNKFILELERQGGRTAANSQKEDAHHDI